MKFPGLCDNEIWIWLNTDYLPLPSLRLFQAGWLFVAFLYATSMLQAALQQSFLPWAAFMGFSIGYCWAPSTAAPLIWQKNLYLGLSISTPSMAPWLLPEPLVFIFSFWLLESTCMSQRAYETGPSSRHSPNPIPSTVLKLLSSLWLSNKWHQNSVA